MAVEPVNSVKIFMFPWLAYGHITPHLELAKKLSQRGFFIYFCSTSINLGFIEKKITEKYSASIQLVELQLPDTPELSPRYHTTNGLPLHLIPTLNKALKKARPNLSNILKTLNPDLVIYDVLLTWFGPLTSVLNIPAVKFSTSAVTALGYCCHIVIKPGLEFPFPAIRLTDFEQARALKNIQSGAADAADAEDTDPEIDVQKRFCDSFVLMKTSREIEGKYMDYLTDISTMKVVPLGPLFQDPVADRDENNELIQWLGMKPECSSVFVSFGSEYFLTKEEMKEIALGLELSNVNFIWVVRFSEGEKMRPEEALPEGFLERVKNRGRIVEGWAPQVKILGHPSIGGFVSHCGWNSMMESIEYGVPIIAIPMHLDQPFVARLAVEIGAALEVVRGEHQSLDREVIAKVIKDVVIGDVGDNLRSKVRDLSKKMLSREKQEFDEVVELLTQLCGEK